MISTHTKCIDFVLLHKSHFLKNNVIIILMMPKAYLGAYVTAYKFRIWNNVIHHRKHCLLRPV